MNDLAEALRQRYGTTQSREIGVLAVVAPGYIARGLRVFHYPPTNPQTVAPFQLHGFGSDLLTYSLPKPSQALNQRDLIIALVPPEHDHSLKTADFGISTQTLIQQ